MKAGSEQQPVCQATWFGAAMYCEWKTLRSGDGCRYTLPTEWEWEYAARGCEGRLWPWGNSEPTADRGWTWSRIPWQVAQSRIVPPIGSYPRGATPDGIHDMMNYNSYEWCSDEYEEDPGDITGNEVVIIAPGTERLRSARGAPSRRREVISLLDRLLSKTRHAGRVWSRFPCDPTHDVGVFRTVRRVGPGRQCDSRAGSTPRRATAFQLGQIDVQTSSQLLWVLLTFVPEIGGRGHGVSLARAAA
jgi:Sulfatase-modifying factor enzyme 1